MSSAKDALFGFSRENRNKLEGKSSTLVFREGAPRDRWMEEEEDTTIGLVPMPATGRDRISVLRRLFSIISLFPKKETGKALSPSNISNIGQWKKGRREQCIPKCIPKCTSTHATTDAYDMIHDTDVICINIYCFLPSWFFPQVLLLLAKSHARV